MFTARAVARHGAPAGYVDLEFEQAAGCAGCSGMCLWRRLGARQQARLAVPAPIIPGAVVNVSLPERAALFAALVLHGLPWATLLAGAILGGVVVRSDWGVLGGALLALGCLALLTPVLRRQVERATLAALRIEAVR